MLSFDKTYLDRLAAESGFIRDNLEKVMRLVEILKFFHNHASLSQALVLKGGTAINLTVFDMPRLSVDIDLDFNNNCSREEMLTQREAINDLVMRYMATVAMPSRQSRTHSVLISLEMSQSTHWHLSNSSPARLMPWLIVVQCVTCMM